MADEKSNPTTVGDETQFQVNDVPGRSSNSESTRRSLDEEKYPRQVSQEAEKPDPDVERSLSLANTTENANVVPPAADTNDPNVVDWDGPNDPEKAINWPSRVVLRNIAVISSITFLTPLSSSMIAPGVPNVLRDFHSTNETVASFIVSIYVLGYALGPLVIAPFSEMYGRLPLYYVNNVLFIAWTIGCALSPNIPALLIFRFLAGISGSTPLTNGGGSIADMIRQEKRGGAMAIFALGPLLGPVIGPVAGGYLTQAKGWRWNFWVVTMAAGVLCVLSFIFMRETYEPVLLERRAARLRKETNNPNLYSKLKSKKLPREYFRQSIVRPTKMLFLSPIVACLSIYMAIAYGYLYLLFTTLTRVFEGRYHFSQGNVGLTYLGIGVGAFLGLVVFGIASDKVVKRMAGKGEMKPEYRLPPLIPGSLAIPVGLFFYGWSAEKDLPWIVPIIGTMFVGIGLIAAFLPIQTYLVDAFTRHAASALAATTVLRSLVGAFLPLAGPALYNALGLGWGNSLLGFIALTMLPISWFIYHYGERIRKSPRFQISL